ncbi:hypothetical protein H0H93_008729 [Arthromyces matolae]|nr:hypothetical protein H0H93_008729 [Arthromyces matolae]
MFFRPSTKQASLTIDFVIVGGNIAGLACAIALRRVGHRVTVLEEDDLETLNERRSKLSLSASSSVSIFNNSTTLFTLLMAFTIDETGELLGTHHWDKEVLSETRGEFVFTQHSALQDLLYELALFSGANVRLGTKVSAIDAVNRTVTLSNSCEQLQADVIIGADGVEGLTRGLLGPPVKEQLASEQMNLYSMCLPRNEIEQDSELAYLYNQRFVTMFNWFGDGHSVLGFPVGDGSEFGLFIYGPATPVECGMQWDKAIASDSLEPVFAKAEPSLRKLGRLGKKVTCTTVRMHPELVDWVHESGHLVVIGEAAHPLPPGSVQGAAMTIEDAAVLGKLFSHLRHRDQITNFLWAFQDLRQPRCDSVMTKEAGIVMYMTMPPGQAQQQRDDTMRAKRDAGIGILEASDDIEESPEWVEIKEVFGYDAEDDADNWWVQWGLLRERASGADVSYESLPIHVRKAVRH